LPADNTSSHRELQRLREQSENAEFVELAEKLLAEIERDREESRRRFDRTTENLEYGRAWSQNLSRGGPERRAIVSGACTASPGKRIGAQFRREEGQVLVKPCPSCPTGGGSKKRCKPASAIVGRFSH
jgi:hypothetical protein